MNNIQIGLDIGTSLSVIGTTILFLKSSVTQSKKNRTFAISKQRIENMSLIITDFTKIIEKGENIVRDIRARQSGRKRIVTADVYTEYCIDVIQYLRVNLKLRFHVWATEEEFRIFKAIEDLIITWHNNFATASNNKDDKNIPSFDRLIEDISDEIFKLSEILRIEIERINA